MFDQVQLIFFNLLQYKRALQKEARGSQAGGTTPISVPACKGNAKRS
jgi:hypothetical protein